MNAAQTDLQQLRIKHILYKSKVRAALYGGTIDPIFFSANGQVNQWLDQVGLVKFRQEPEIRELILIQTELNATVKYLTELYKSGKIDQAHDGLSKIESQSEKFIKLVSQLESRFSN